MFGLLAGGVTRAAEPADGQPRLHIEPIQAGDSLASTLIRAGVPRGEAAAAASSAAGKMNGANYRPGGELRITFLQPPRGGEARFIGFVYPVEINRDIIVRREGTSFVAQGMERPVARETIRAGRVIRSSFYQTAIDAGVPPEMVGQLIRVFSYDVDFQREIHAGDRFEVLWEGMRDDAGRVIRATSLRYAALHLHGRVLALYRFDGGNGEEAGWYDAQGRSVRKALLRTPVDAATIVSGFGMRMHPILGYSRMHRGLDFGAPSGARIMAAGDGVVEQVGPSGEYGNYIRLRHSGELSTAYAHLSRFAPGLREGATVKQGQVIGYVGSTGMATGPHLHFEVLVGGEQVDPANQRFAANRQLAGRDLARFLAEVRAIEADRQRHRDPFVQRANDLTVAQRLDPAIRTER